MTLKGWRACLYRPSAQSRGFYYEYANNSNLICYCIGLDNLDGIRSNKQSKTISSRHLDGSFWCSRNDACPVWFYKCSVHTMTPTEKAILKRLQEYTDELYMCHLYDSANDGEFLETVAVEFRRLTKLVEDHDAAGKWQDMLGAPTDGTPVQVVEDGVISVASYSSGVWTCQGDGRDAIQSQTDFGTDYLEVVPDYWKPLDQAPKHDRDSDNA